MNILEKIGMIGLFGILINADEMISVLGIVFALIITLIMLFFYLVDWEAIEQQKN